MGKILVQRSTPDKRLLPGMLDATAGGVVQANKQLLDPRVAKRKKSWALPVSPLPSTGSSISKIKIAVSGRVVQLRLSRSTSPYRKMKSVKILLADAGRNHRTLDQFTPDSLKALALWMKRNAKNEAVETETAE